MLASALELLTPFRIGKSLEIKNRMVLAPLTRGRCTPNPENPFDPISKIPNDLMAEYYAQRASAGLLITEATAISEDGYGWSNAPGIYTDDHITGWKKVTESVHEAGGAIFLQLWHMGRYTHSSFHPKSGKIFSASAVKISHGQVRTVTGEKVDFEVPEPLSIDRIQSTIQDYVRAARYAKEAGFDGVEVHAANGYLIDEFLQTRTNQRTDDYGGSMENRYRFLKEIIEATINDGAFSADRIGFRLSPNGVFGDMGSEDNPEMFQYVAKETNQYGLAYLHCMDGLGFGFHNKSRVVTLADLRKHFDGPIMSNVGLTKEIAEGVLRSGAADLCAFGRSFISNPDLPLRFEKDLPLNDDPLPETYWAPIGAKGYTDFPFYKEGQEKEKEEL